MDNRFTSVPDFSTRRRIPLLGKIRLGVKVKSEKTGAEYPKEVPYFVVPPEVAKIYGEKPTELEVFIPSANRGLSFPCSLRRYGQTAGLKCIGNKTVGYDIVNKKDVECPCKYYTGIDEEGKPCKTECDEVGFLFVILYRVNIGGVYQIRTTSINSVTDILSGMDYVELLLKRPCAFVPLVLKREPTETHHDQKKQTHYTMKLQFVGDVDKANLLIQDSKRIYTSDFILPAPKDENPLTEKADIIEHNGITDEEKDVEEVSPVKTDKKTEIKEEKEISEFQRKVIFAKLKDKKIKKEDLKEYLKMEFGLESTKDILQSQFEQVINWINQR